MNNPMALLAGALLSLMLGFGGGWTANGWRLHANLSEQQATRSAEIASQSQEAIKDLADASRKVKESADSANVQVSTLGAKLDAIHKEFKNAKPAPLPADCRLDDVRLRNITASVAALNETITRLKSSAALQNADRP